MSHDRQIILPLHLTTRNAFTSHGISAITQGPTKFNALKSLFWTVNDCIFNVWVKSSGTAEHQKHNSWGVLPPASSFPPWGKLSPACSLVPVPWAPPQFLIPVLFFFLDCNESLLQSTVSSLLWQLSLVAGGRGYSLVAMHELLIAVASLVAE